MKAKAAKTQRDVKVNKQHADEVKQRKRTKYCKKTMYLTKAALTFTVHMVKVKIKKR